LFCFFFGFIVLRAGYGVNDDIQIIAMASGYWGGTPIPFLVFSNVALGFVLNFLYSLHTSINWEIWLFIAVHFLSIWALIFLVLSCSNMRPVIKMLGILIVLSCGIHFLLKITFTTVAVMASIAGVCLLLTAAQSRSRLKAFLVVWGTVLILVASLIRIESVALVFLPIIPFLIYSYRLFNIRRFVLTSVIAGCLLLGFYLFDNAYISHFPEWNSYKTYNLTRSMIHDTPRLMNMYRAIKNISWSANDSIIFERWFLSDPNVYSIEKLQYLAQHVSDKQKTILNSILFLPDRLSDLVTFPYALMLVSLWLAILLYSSVLRKSLVPSLVATAFIILIIILLEWTQKAPVRILLSLLTAVIFFTFWGWRWSDAERPQTSLAPAANGVFFKLGFQSMLLSLLIVAVFVLQQSISTSQENIRRQFIYREVVSQIQALQARGKIARNALIVSPVYGIPWEWSNPLFLDFPKIKYLTTNWGTFSPVYSDVLRGFQIQSLPSGFYLKENVYLMTNRSTMRAVVQFIKEHEGVNVYAKGIYTIPRQYSSGTVFYEVVLFKMTRQP